ncbi:hypothetical protein H6F88_21675 [Oculatella sp. FACHB-28]|uniref:hypothetical protein n=1 Tax=Oculatella sp. FACHB-28 TaxID=2692845 RepID=UPI001685E560|nr:hypothetical protein [Oculatella sp. FACHB-28]MBD2058574.1 hypothetical protein [Oculatella sp. FACHB-28]
MTHSNNNDRTRIQSDRPTSIQNDHHQVYHTSGNQVSDRRRILNDREVELVNQDLVNPNLSIGNGNRTASPASYQNGYTQGRVVERQAYEENLRVRDDNSASRGLLLGILLTSLLGLTVGALYFVNQQSQTPVVPVPVEPQEETETNNTEVRERIIERTREIVPVPQPQAPAPQQPAAEPAPAVPPASTTQPEAVLPEIAQPEAAQPEAVQPDPAQPEVSEPAPPAANPVQ